MGVGAAQGVRAGRVAVYASAARQDALKATMSHHYARVPIRTSSPASSRSAEAVTLPTIAPRTTSPAAPRGERWCPKWPPNRLPICNSHPFVIDRHLNVTVMEFTEVSEAQKRLRELDRSAIARIDSKAIELSPRRYPHR